MGLFGFFKKKRNEPIYYREHTERPYISPDRNMKDWNERVSMFPNAAVVKEMLIRNENGLLPGHIYMMYWLNKYTNKRVPAYFEYKYGINFEDEVLFLKENYLLNNDTKPTNSGLELIDKYHKIIDNHQKANKKKTDDEIYNDAIKSTLEQKTSLEMQGFEQYTYLANHNSFSICKELDDQVFDISGLEIGVNAPPMHKKCRCSISSYMDREAFEKDLKRRGL